MAGSRVAVNPRRTVYSAGPGVLVWLSCREESKLEAGSCSQGKLLGA